MFGAYTVKQWYDDPQHPGRQVGWAEPETTPDYVRPDMNLTIDTPPHAGISCPPLLLPALLSRGER